ncbi:hypothetical protein H0H81_000501, partial [Sphagnurus paluster]
MSATLAFLMTRWMQRFTQKERDYFNEVFEENPHARERIWLRVYKWLKRALGRTARASDNVDAVGAIGDPVDIGPADTESAKAAAVPGGEAAGGGNSMASTLEHPIPAISQGSEAGPSVAVVEEVFQPSNTVYPPVNTDSGHVNPPTSQGAEATKSFIKTLLSIVQSWNVGHGLARLFQNFLLRAPQNLADRERNAPQMGSMDAGETRVDNR